MSQGARKDGLGSNSFQHEPLLRDQVRQRGYKLAAMADTDIAIGEAIRCDALLDRLNISRPGNE